MRFKSFFGHARFYLKQTGRRVEVYHSNTSDNFLCMLHLIAFKSPIERWSEVFAPGWSEPGLFNITNTKYEHYSIDLFCGGQT